MAAGPIAERNQDATIYVGGLDEKVNETLLWELFVQAGPVVNVHMPKDRVSMAHQGYGFIEFLGEDDADYAIKIMNMIKLYGKPIRVNKASNHQKTLDIGANIFIGNLDPEVDEKLLYDTFSAFGVILQTPKIMRDISTGNSKGFAFINYASFEASDAAIEAMNGQYLCNRPITISYAFKKDSKGERHGSAAERLLAAQNPLSQADKPHSLFADAPTPQAGGAPPLPPPPVPPGGLGIPPPFNLPPAGGAQPPLPPLPPLPVPAANTGEPSPAPVPKVSQAPPLPPSMVPPTPNMNFPPGQGPPVPLPPGAPQGPGPLRQPWQMPPMPPGGRTIPECEKSKFPYNEPDPLQCDKYYVCENMVRSTHLCDDGYVFDTASRHCSLPFSVNCTDRPKLQEPKSSDRCPRENGMFRHLGFCDQYVYCQNGDASLVTCPMGLIFDDKNGICEFPDVAERPDCSPEEILRFKCPTTVSERLLPKEDDCRFFFRCLPNGHPRLAGCEQGLVFNRESLRCDLPKFVKGCENYYTPLRISQQEHSDLLHSSEVNPSKKKLNEIERTNKGTNNTSQPIIPHTTDITKENAANFANTAKIPAHIRHEEFSRPQTPKTKNEHLHKDTSERKEIELGTLNLLTEKKFRLKDLKYGSKEQNEEPIKILNSKVNDEQKYIAFQNVSTVSSPEHFAKKTTSDTIYPSTDLDTTSLRMKGLTYGKHSKSESIELEEAVTSELLTDNSSGSLDSTSSGPVQEGPVLDSRSGNHFSSRTPPAALHLLNIFGKLEEVATSKILTDNPPDLFDSVPNSNSHSGNSFSTRTPPAALHHLNLFRKRPGTQYQERTTGGSSMSSHRSTGETSGTIETGKRGEQKANNELISMKNKPDDRDEFKGDDLSRPLGVEVTITKDNVLKGDAILGTIEVGKYNDMKETVKLKNGESDFNDELPVITKQEFLVKGSIDNTPSILNGAQTRVSKDDIPKRLTELDKQDDSVKSELLQDGKNDLKDKLSVSIQEEEPINDSKDHIATQPIILKLSTKSNEAFEIDDLKVELIDTSPATGNKIMSEAKNEVRITDNAKVKVINTSPANGSKIMNDAKNDEHVTEHVEDLTDDVKAEAMDTSSAIGSKIVNNAKNDEHATDDVEDLTDHVKADVRDTSPTTVSKIMSDANHEEHITDDVKDLTDDVKAKVMDTSSAMGSTIVSDAKNEEYITDDEEVLSLTEKVESNKERINDEGESSVKKGISMNAFGADLDNHNEMSFMVEEKGLKADSEVTKSEVKVLAEDGQSKENFNKNNLIATHNKTDETAQEEELVKKFRVPSLPEMTVKSETILIKNVDEIESRIAPIESVVSNKAENFNENSLGEFSLREQIEKEKDLASEKNPEILAENLKNDPKGNIGNVPVNLAAKGDVLNSEQGMDLPEVEKANKKHSDNLPNIWNETTHVPMSDILPEKRNINDTAVAKENFDTEIAEISPSEIESSDIFKKSDKPNFRKFKPKIDTKAFISSRRGGLFQDTKLDQPKSFGLPARVSGDLEVRHPSTVSTWNGRNKSTVDDEKSTEVLKSTETPVMAEQIDNKKDLGSDRKDEILSENSKISPLEISNDKHAIIETKSDILIEKENSIPVILSGNKNNNEPSVDKENAEDLPLKPGSKNTDFKGIDKPGLHKFQPKADIKAFIASRRGGFLQNKESNQPGRFPPRNSGSSGDRRSSIAITLNTRNRLKFNNEKSVEHVSTVLEEEPIIAGKLPQTVETLPSTNKFDGLRFTLENRRRPFSSFKMPSRQVTAN